MSDFKKYQCRECEHIYDEAKGDPDSGLAPGTRWADIPDDWSCPICGAPKDFFKAIRKHPYGDEANDWEGVCIPSPIRAQESNFASLVAGAPFGLKAEV